MAEVIGKRRLFAEKRRKLTECPPIEINDLALNTRLTPARDAEKPEVFAALLAFRSLRFSLKTS
jgi:hypothetical protein